MKDENKQKWLGMFDRHFPSLSQLIGRYRMDCKIGLTIKMFRAAKLRTSRGITKGISVDVLYL